MGELAIAPTLTCPRCETALDPTGVAGRLQCPVCRWRGEAYVFAPRQLDSAAAEAALPDDATCLHHPRKKAVAVCAGTGDYICSLCAVEVEGQTFSAQFLDAGGKAKASKAFDRFLPRPDSQVYLYLILMFIPYVNVIAFPFAFLWIPHGFFLYFKALRLRRENEVFARVMGRGSVIAIPILLVIEALVWLALLGVVIFAIMKDRS